MIPRRKIACRACRAAKLRCWFETRTDKCARCVGNNIECIVDSAPIPSTYRAASAPNTPIVSPLSASPPLKSSASLPPPSEPSTSSTPRTTATSTPILGTFNDVYAPSSSPARDRASSLGDMSSTQLLLCKYLISVITLTYKIPT
ncbi:hypothetical protein T439DRAFT_329147 [Meredithblackwellia eburnea MCA 4105]